MSTSESSPQATPVSRFAELAAEVARLAPAEGAAVVAALSDSEAAAVLHELGPVHSEEVLLALGDERRRAVLAASSAAEAAQWTTNFTFPEGSVGRLMEPPQPVFPPQLTVAETVERIRELVKTVFVTYGYVTDPGGVLLGVVAMRDLLLARPGDRLEQVMLREAFSLRPEMPLLDAMKLVVNRHFPVYPVCDEGGRLVGVVRGRTMFEEQAFEISAQAGTMVGVEKEERLSTPWQRSLRLRHPWLQLNLLTAFLAAAVVGVFQGTIDRLVVLAMFLPVLAGQSGNTGCQALAVTLRGLTLGELRSGRERALVLKESLLGLLNGGMVGITAGLGMFVVARLEHNPAAATLAFVVFFAMIGSCVVSGLAGAMIPLTLRKLGFDPATASSIFLTTATDVASMGMFLGLATLFV